MQLRNRGIALITTLMLMVVVSGLAALLFARTLNEIRNSADDAAIVQTLMIARGGANLGGAVLQGPVRDRLSEIVEDESSTTGRWSFGEGDANSNEPNPTSVINALTSGAGSVAGQLQGRIDALVCNQAITPSGNTARVDMRIYVSNQACGENLPSGIKLPSGRFVKGNPRGGGGGAASQTYAIPFVMVSEAQQGKYKRNVVVQGEYQFTVGRSSFARYALFTNVHSAPNGGEIWFTDNTLFDGPVHTNQFFRFYRQSWFGGEVTSAGCRTPLATSCRQNDFSRQGAEFYGEGFVRYQNMQPPTSPSYTNRYGTQAPELAGGVDWAANFVELPTNQQDQKAAAQNEGLYFSGQLYSLNLWAADSNGNPLTKDLNGNWSPAATYQYIEGCEERGRGRNRRVTCTTYRYGSDGDLYRQRNNGGWQLEQADFNGVIYANQGIDRFTGPTRSPSNSSNPDDAPPALASFAEITVAAARQVRIAGDLKYETPPCEGSPERDRNGNVTPAICDNLNVKNVLGVYVQDSDILIGNNNVDRSINAPDNVTIQGVLMSGEGVVTVEDYNVGVPRGDVNLLGGLIEYNYGAFGTFNAATGQRRTGYGRRFTYDQRMRQGVSPPYFPTVGQDGVQGVIVFSFGQREQVY